MQLMCFEVASTYRMYCASYKDQLAGEFSAHQKAALNAYGNVEFESFFKCVCSLPHITKLADEEPEF